MKKFLSIAHRSLAELGVATYKELWTKAQSEGYQGLEVSALATFEKSADNKFHAIFSSANEDRHGDIVHQDFDLKGFKKNPVFLDSHNYGSIESIIGRVSKISIKDGKLQGDIEFAAQNPRGALAAYLAEGGFLNTTSIGFIPREFNDKGEILKSELLEVSAVSVPANADAQFEKTIKPESPEDEPKQEDQPADEPEPGAPEPAPEAASVDPEPEPAPQKTINRRAIAAKAVSDMVEERRKYLRLIARSVQQLTDENKQDQKRKIYQVIRKLMNQ